MTLSLSFAKVEVRITDKLAINWQNFARVRLQLKFAFIIRPNYSCAKCMMITWTVDVGLAIRWTRFSCSILYSTCILRYESQQQELQFTF